jgi:hypothetical protein
MALSAEQLRNLFLVPNYDHVYFIGKKARRLTFLSQQVRALNLVWALHSTGEIDRDTEVAVVGAGLSGLTASVAAQQLGARVTLYERTTDLMPLQKGTLHRLVYPRVSEWPSPGWADPFTNLPCLNWGAGTAAQVAATILEQWQGLARNTSEQTQRVIERFRQDVHGIVLHPTNRRPIVLSTGESYKQSTFDCVLLAVGFGLERDFPGGPSLSYWENDNLDRSPLVGRLPHKFLISGCGDGGLVDTLRLSIARFDYRWLFSTLLSSDKVPNRMMEELLLLDRDAGTCRDDLGNPHYDNQGIFLYHGYRELNVGKDLIASLRERIRQDTEVFLNGPLSTPFGLDSSLLHRFLVFLLFEHGRLQYLSGRIQSIIRHAPEQPIMATIRNPIGDTSLLIDQAVIRHGAVPMVHRLLPGIDLGDLLPGPTDSFEDETKHPLYPEDFLMVPRLTDLKQTSRIKHSVTNLSLAAETVLGTLREATFSLRIDKNGPEYVVQNAVGCSWSSETFQGINVRIEMPNSEHLREDPQPIRPLKCGVGIGNSVQPGTSGTLGLFVVLNSKEQGFLTSTTALGDPSKLRVGDTVCQPETDPSQIIGEIRAFVRPVIGAGQVQAPWNEANEHDTAVVLLNPAITFRQEFEARHGPLPAPRGIAELHLGQRVFKVGRSSGLTWGHVKATNVWKSVKTWGGAKYEYDGLFGIAEETGSKFFLPGDAGAAVVAESGEVLGILIAADAELAVAYPIDIALNSMNCRLLD